MKIKNKVIIIAIIIVALFVLIGCIREENPRIQNNPITRSLIEVRHGGTIISETINFEKGVLISNLDFIGYGFDPKSINLGYNKDFSGLELFELKNINNFGKIIIYTGLERFPAKAKVICQINNDLLKQEISNITKNYITLEIDCEDVQPCCLILIEPIN